MEGLDREPTWGDTVCVRPDARLAMRPGAVAEVVGIRCVDTVAQAQALGLPIGSKLYLIEFGEETGGPPVLATPIYAAPIDTYVIKATALSDEDSRLLAEVLRGTEGDADVLLAGVRDRRLTARDKERVISAVSYAFSATGVDNDREVTPRRERLERLLDIVNRIGAT